MADPLYFSLWFSSFDVDDMLPQALTVLQQFPFSAIRPGIAGLVLAPVSWNEPTILERRFNPGISPEEAILIASDLLHEDYAYVFDAYWDLWTTPEGSSEWVLTPAKVQFIVHGLEFDDGVYQQEGHIKVDFGLDSQFLQEQMQLTPEAEAKVKINVQKLVGFSTRVEQNSGATARVLWSESDENLAQKLINRIQRVQ